GGGIVHRRRARRDPVAGLRHPPSGRPRTARRGGCGHHEGNTMKTIEVAGARFCYDEAGEDRDGTIIVLHGGRGIGGHRRELQAYRPLADRYRVIAYDQRGCGLTSLTPPFTFARLADDVDEMRKALVGDKRVVLLGGSFGGMIALSAAVRHPGAFSHLMLRG